MMENEGVIAIISKSVVERLLKGKYETILSQNEFSHEKSHYFNQSKDFKITESSELKNYTLEDFTYFKVLGSG